jgi:7-carboxy-7-deazaguanine synthase
VFVRFTGCDLRCNYCDTAYAFTGGREASREEILAEVARHPCRLVLLTGGEPMLQRELPELARDLLERGYEVTVETHGQAPLDALPAAVVRIADVKTPGSGEPAGDLTWLARLLPHDEVKFVVSSEEDFRWSADVIRRHGLEDRVTVLVGPVLGRVEPRDLARWILESGLRARLNLQIHKVVWGPDARGV